MKTTRFLLCVGLTLGCVAGAPATTAHAADGTWNQTAAGPYDWGTNTNWVSNTIADGANFTATFGNISGAQTVNLDTDRTIGNIAYTSSNNFQMTLSGGNLTLDGTSTPIVNVTNSRTLRIDSVIAGNDGLQKNGNGLLDLFASNTFTGGLFLNGGTVRSATPGVDSLGGSGSAITVIGDSSLQFGVGTAGGNYTINKSLQVDATRTLTVIKGGAGFIDITGVVSGNGTIKGNDSGTGNDRPLIFSNTGNTFTGAIDLLGTRSTITVASLSDAVGSGNILFGSTASGGSAFQLGTQAVAPLVLTNRAFDLQTGTGQINNLNASAGNTLTVNSNLVATGSNNRTLQLGGSNAGVNRFAGNIANPTGGGAVTVTKTDGGTWALSGTNTYSGNTNLSAVGTTGRLTFQGSQSLSPNTSLVFAQNSSNVQSVSFLDDGVGTINFTRPISFGGSNTSQNLNIFVGNNNTANGGSSSGTTTDSTVEVGSITFTSVATDTNTTTINATGANGYRLQTGIITLNNLVTRTAGQTTVTALNPTTANMTVASITMATGNQGSGLDGIPVLRLTGTSTNNVVAGAISNAPDFATGQALSLQKQGNSTWALNGDNTYTGTTTVSAGTLLINGNSTLATGAVSVTGGTLGGNGTIGGSVTFSGVGASFLSPGNSPGQLTVAGLSLGNATTTTMELGGTTLGTLYDNTTVTADGTLVYDGTLNVVNFGAFDMDAGSFTYDLFSFSGSTSPSGSFDVVTVNGNGLLNDGFGVWTGSNGGNASYTFTQSSGNLIISVVPEPTTLVFLGVAAVAGIAASRRRRLTNA